MTLSRIGILGLLTLGIVLRLVNLDGVTSRTPDERTYAQHATVFLDRGTAGLRQLADQYRRDPALKLYPSPTRAGFIHLNAAAMALTGRHDIEVLPAVSCLASILSLVVLAFAGMRFFPITATLAGLLFVAVSPVELPLARRAWADATVEIISIAMAYVTCEIAENPSGIWVILLAALSAIGITVKEFSAVTSMICVGWLLFVLGFQRREWKKAGQIVAAVAIGAVLSIAWLADSVGGPADYLRMVFGLPGAMSHNAYQLEYASGPPWLLLDGMWILSPAAVLLSIPGFYAALRSPNRSWRWIAVFVLAQLAITAAMPLSLDLRYISPAIGLFCLIAGLGVWQILVWCRDMKVATGAAVAILAIAAWTDYQRFQRIFVRDGTPDLAIKFLIDER